MTPESMASSSGMTQEESCSSSPTPVYEHRRRGSEKEFTYIEETEINAIPKQEKQHEEENRLIFLPAAWIIQLIAFQVNIIIEIYGLTRRAFNSCWSIVAEPVHRTVQAKDRATEAMSQNIAMLSQVPPKVTEGGGIVVRKLGLGCLAATYVCSMLIILMFFALFLSFTFVTLWVEEPVIIRKPLYFDYTQPNPSATLSLIPSNGAKVSRKRVIPAGHKFYATVTLVMPESDHNRQIGVFQVMAELISGGDKVFARSSQPCMLPFRSAPVRLAKIVLMGLPLLMGILGETQTLVIHLIDYQEKNIPTESVKIILQPKAWTSGLPEFHSAEVDIRSQLPWIKEFTRNWKWTFWVWNALTFYILLVGLIVCCCKQVLFLRSTTGKTDNKQPNKDGQESHNVMTDNIMPERGRKQCRGKIKHVSFTDESPTISLHHSPATFTARHGEGEKSEIVEESLTDEKNSTFSSASLCTEVATEHGC